jgi:hypothetical protein
VRSASFELKQAEPEAGHEFEAKVISIGRIDGRPFTQAGQDWMRRQKR